MIISELPRFWYHLIARFFVELKKTVFKAPIETKKALILQDFAINSPLIIRSVHLILESASQRIDLLSKVVEDFRALVLCVVLDGGIVSYYALAWEIEFAFTLRLI